MPRTVDVFEPGDSIEYQTESMSEPRRGLIERVGAGGWYMEGGDFVPLMAHAVRIQSRRQRESRGPSRRQRESRPPGSSAVATAAPPDSTASTDSIESPDPAAGPTSPSLPPPAAGSPSLAADLEAVMALPLPESQAACEPRIRLSMRAARMLGSDAARCLAHALASYPEFKGSGGHARWRAWSLEKFGMATRTAEQYLAAGRVLLSLVHHGALNRRIASWDLHKLELLHSIPVDQVPALVEHGNLDDLTREELREKLRRLKLGKEDAAAPTETRPPRAPKPSMEIAAVIERLAELSGAEAERIGQASLTVEPLVAARAGAMCWELAARHAQRTGYVFSEEQISALRDLHGSIGAWLEGLGK